MISFFEGACYRTSYFPPHFSGPLSPWISVLGIGCPIPAPMACNLLPWWLGWLKNVVGASELKFGRGNYVAIDLIVCTLSVIGLLHFVFDCLNLRLCLVMTGHR